MEKGEEKAYIRDQRNRIATLYEKLKKEKQRKNELHQKVQAFNEIKLKMEQTRHDPDSYQQADP